MSKSLEALDEICGYYYQTHQYRLIEKELKALEIIKNKRVDVGFLMSCKTIEEYNSKETNYIAYYLTQEEYNLLKEVLSDGN